jgi:hypothetical protein
MSLSRSSSKKKLCPKNQIRMRVCQNRCVKQKTLNEKVAKKLYNNKRSSNISWTSRRSKKRSSSRRSRKKSSSKYYTPNLIPSPLQKNKNKKGTPSPPRNQSIISQIRKGTKLKKRSPLRKKSPSPMSNVFNELRKKQFNLKPTETIKYKPKQPNHYLLDKILKKRKNFSPNEKKSSNDENDWLDGIRRREFY